MMIERIDGCAFFQKFFGVLAGTVNTIHKSDLRDAVGIDLLNKINIALGVGRHSVSEMASGILDFAPPECQFAIDSRNEGTLTFVRSRSWDVLPHQFLGAIG